MARVLIIDDSEHIRQLLAITLRMKKHEVVQAENGLEGLEKLRGGGFDLVLVDLDMPVMSGLEFLERVRTEIGAKAPRCLVLTAEAREVRERALSLGAAGALTKPFSPLALFEEIAKHLP
jgi:two-component system chemotaxis response regulator CheY